MARPRVAKPTASQLLRELEQLRNTYDPAAAARKVELLDAIESRSLPTAGEVLALHERLCFLRAYPDNAQVLAVAERVMAGFAGRADLRRYRRVLADTGIAGTDTHFRFYWLTARWLAKHWPGQLTIDWKEFDQGERIEKILHLLMPYSESPALDSFGFSAREWIERLKGPGETDAAFLIRRFEAMPAETPIREHLYEEIDPPLVLAPGPATPARSLERWDKSPVVYRTSPLERKRPDLRRAIAAASMTVRSLPPREGRQFVELANACMVPRQRDLLAFLNADERDVRLVDFGDGLQFACLGVVPERRLMLESVYACLTLNNGVPIGYVLCSAFFESAEVAYNVFETFRGAEAAKNYARVLAMVRRLFGAESFAIDPYQLGHNNAEGQESGAWWFYYKLGFRPRDAEVRRLAREEVAKLRKNPEHRTTRARLNELASQYMFLQLGRPRRDVLGEISLGGIGLHISRVLAERGGGDREAALEACAEDAACLLHLRSRKGLTPGERLAWVRWSPLVLALPGVARWSPANRRALREVVRAKGGRRESDFVRLFDRHTPLRRALLKLSQDED